ncbi:TULIP family P47-like protein [Clostridium sp. CF012]|uniref:TULIP family P47-like protein n=1 Tax=Clostridium sp. CF012 TaxID=2843319 RepID=UPI001C0D0A90|nr:TULIP family P47-like protein [Clostridium sp. CF012]MBU3146261.1 TULIP family P47-like protein [Clostridium sp. CF012]
MSDNLKIKNHSVSLEVENLDNILKDAVLNTGLYKNAVMLQKSEEQLENPNILLGDSVTTNGWDSVYAIRANYLNLAIQEKHTSPPNFSQDLDDSGDIFKVDGNFGDWQIIEGGDGSNVNMKIPIKDGIYTSSTGKQISLNDVSAVVQVKLAYFPEVLSEQFEDGSYDLKINTTQTNQQNPVVSLLYMNFPPDSKISTINKAIIQSMLQLWLNDNLKAFDNVFSTVYLKNLSSGEDFKWLKTTYMSYAYTDNGTLNSSVFGVLCMTNNRSADALSHQITSVAFEKDDSSVFIINTQLFLKYQFLPGVQQDFSKDKDKFVLNENMITAKNLSMEGIKYGCITYHPKIDNFMVSFEPTQIRTTTHISVNISPGIDAYIDMDSFQTLELTVNDKGEQCLTYANLGEPIVIHRVVTDPAIIITEIILSGIVAICGILIERVVKDVVNRVIVGIVVAVVIAAINGISQIISNCIANGVANNVPSISTLVKIATNQIAWPLCDPNDPDRYVLRTVVYNGGIILKGDPGFIESSNTNQEASNY